MSTPPESPPEHQRSSLSEKLARRRERHVQHSMAYRVLFVIAAFAVLLGGIALIPLPGPGWAIVFVGLGMLALEFDVAYSSGALTFEGADKGTLTANFSLFPLMLTPPRNRHAAHYEGKVFKSFPVDAMHGTWVS